jgi:hypothetical protein
MTGSCAQCNSPRLYVVKDGGTIFCLDCLFFVQVKKSCSGNCHVRCMKCTYSKERLRQTANGIIAMEKRFGNTY